MNLGQGIIQKIILVSILITIFSSCTIGSDDDENFYFANSNNNKFFANNRRNCQPNYYFDVDYFKCRLCDGNFHLSVSRQKNQCYCDKNSTEIFEYDNILRRPICKPQTEVVPETKCPLHFVNSTDFSAVRKVVRVYRLPISSTKQQQKCLCDSRLNEQYHGKYCIRYELFKDLKNYQQYKNLPLTQTLNLSYELKFIVLFCKILHRRDYCNYLANLCVLTHYHLDKYGPCYSFYQQQNQHMAIDEGGNVYGSSEGNEFDGGEKMKPFLFFRGRKSNKNLFDKFIDFSYNIENVNSTINFTILNYNLYGNVSELRPMKLSDLNLCNQYTTYMDGVKFASNYFSKCSINLRELIALMPDTRFSTLYLNYFENQANFLQIVPILIRNAYEANKQEDIERWQLVKRFFLIDTVSGKNVKIIGKNTNNDDDGDEMATAKFYEQYSQINYVKSIEMRFHLSDDDENSDEYNKINIPVIIMEYGSMNLTQIANAMKSSVTYDESQLYNVDFSFKIKFTKRPNLNFFFQIILPIFILIASFNAFMSTFFYKISQQKLEYDLSILLNFIINLMANVSNAFFIFILMFIAYVFFVYKTQSSVVKIMLPLEREEAVIEILLVFAIIFKIVKLMKLFCDMITLDIFFIDWERPKAYNTSDHFFHGSNKSHPGTPSITSSFKPTLSSPSPTNDCVSAWRNYFVANEWQELITKRKVSVQLHIIFVIAALMLFGFENFASTDFDFNLNVTNFQHYLSYYRMDKEASDIVNGNIILKVATGAFIYLIAYILQRIWNFFIYERFIDNCLQQFIDVASIANISVLILINSYGFYIHGRSVHGRSDIDTFNMILQFKREEENLCGHRGLLPSSDQQTYTILAPRNLRVFYEKLISPIQNKSNHYHQQFNHHSMKFEQNFEKTILTYHNINRFFAAFIDHALKDVDYVIKEKNLFEKIFDCELESTINNDSKGIFYFDNGHSFDKVLFYGNENSIFGFEYLLFIFLLFVTGNFLIAILSIGIIFKLIELVINHLTKNNLACKTLIDKRFLI